MRAPPAAADGRHPNSPHLDFSPRFSPEFALPPPAKPDSHGATARQLLLFVVVPQYPGVPLRPQELCHLPRDAGFWGTRGATPPAPWRLFAAGASPRPGAPTPGAAFLLHTPSPLGRSAEPAAGPLSDSPPHCPASSAPWGTPPPLLFPEIPTFPTTPTGGGASLFSRGRSRGAHRCGRFSLPSTVMGDAARTSSP